MRCTAVDTERGGRADEVDVGEDDASARCAECVWVRLVDEDTKLAEAASGVTLIVEDDSVGSVTCGQPEDAFE